MPICKRCGVDHELEVESGNSDAMFDIEIKGGKKVVTVNILAKLPTHLLQEVDPRDFADQLAEQVPNLIRKIGKLPPMMVENLKHQTGKVDDNGNVIEETVRDLPLQKTKLPQHIQELLQVLGLGSGARVIDLDDLMYPADPKSVN